MVAGVSTWTGEDNTMNTNRLLAGIALASTVATVAFLGTTIGFSSTLSSVVEAPGIPIENPEAATTPAAEPDWEAANWWTYDVTIGDREAKPIAVIVHDVDREGLHVGTNQSGGFMGLPISGTFSHELNPTFAGETWRMYDFPLHDGKAWDQPLLGYNLNTTVHAVELEPTQGTNTTQGYAMEASAYGRTVATYTYHPQASWFTELTIYDPQNGDRLFHAELIDHGASWDQAYFVTEPLHEATVEYPAQFPGDETFEVPSGYEEARVNLRATASAGAISASVHDGDGEEVAGVRVLGHGFDIATARVDDPRGDWQLSHLGTGDGETMLQVLGVQAITPEQAPPDTQEKGDSILDGIPDEDPIRTDRDPVPRLETIR